MVHTYAFLAVLILIVCCTLSAAADLRLYVAPGGDDAWSGTLPQANDAGTDGPFATLSRARDAVRELRQSGKADGPVTVLLRGGEYFIAEPLVFTPEDSGTPAAPVTYAAYPGETPQIIGGRKLTGFTKADDGSLTLDLPEVAAGDWTFRRLYAGDRGQIRARFPNFDPTDPYRKGFLYATGSIGGFGYTVGNIHNVGDWMDYEITVPAEGEYHLWTFYGALNEPFGTTDMAGRTAMTFDGGASVPLGDLPDTGGWSATRWSHSATVTLPAGAQKMRWTNLKGGGINLDVFALTDDPNWTPVGDSFPPVAEGRHLIVVQTEDFVAFQGKQLSKGGTGGSEDAFHYGPAEFKPEWLAAPDAEIHIFQSGSCRAYKEIVTIEAIDEATRTVTVGGPEITAGLREGDRYFVENVPGEMDAPGEWYLDREAGRLHWIPDAEYAPGQEVVAPVLGRVVDFQGEADRPVANIRLSGLTFRCTDYAPGDGCIGYQMGSDGVVYLGNATNCSVERCVFRNIGKYGVCAKGGAGHVIRGNEIGHSAEGGVLLLDSASNTVSDNHIYDCGLVYKHIGGVVLQGAGTSDNLIAHNHIHDMSRYGITIKTGGLRNVIEYNRVERTNTETFDTGGIEVTQQDRNLRAGSVIRNNIVLDTYGYSSSYETPVYMSWGIYLDSFAGGYTVTNNITARNSHGGIMYQGGKDNKVHNNIFVDSDAYQVFVTNFMQNGEGLTFERNVVAYSDPKAVLIYAGQLEPETMRFGNNLYFLSGGGEMKVLSRKPAAATFTAWQGAGYDEGSLVADPLFVDAAKDDYTLRPGSPAFGLGFEAIDTSRVGPRPEEEWER